MENKSLQQTFLVFHTFHKFDFFAIPELTEFKCNRHSTLDYSTVKATWAGHGTSQPFCSMCTAVVREAGSTPEAAGSTPKWGSGLLGEVPRTKLYYYITPGPGAIIFTTSSLAIAPLGYFPQ